MRMRAALRTRARSAAGRARRDVSTRRRGTGVRRARTMVSAWLHARGEQPGDGLGSRAGHSLRAHGSRAPTAANAAAGGAVAGGVLVVAWSGSQVFPGTCSRASRAAQGASRAGDAPGFACNTVSWSFRRGRAQGRSCLPGGRDEQPKPSEELREQGTYRCHVDPRVPRAITADGRRDRVGSWGRSAVTLRGSRPSAGAVAGVRRGHPG